MIPEIELEVIGQGYLPSYSQVLVEVKLPEAAHEFASAYYGQLWHRPRNVLVIPV
jgi:hypothetical protein